MTQSVEHTTDRLDRTILKILAEDPRMPYSDIADRLLEEDYEMSAEGVRKRVTRLLDITSPFFLLEPQEHDWEIVRIAIWAADEHGAKDDAHATISEMPFWLVCNGIGTYDIYAVASVPSNAEIDDLVRQVRELDSVADLEFTIETGRDTNVDNYLLP